MHLTQNSLSCAQIPQLRTPPTIPRQLPAASCLLKAAELRSTATEMLAVPVSLEFRLLQRPLGHSASRLRRHTMALMPMSRLHDMALRVFSLSALSGNLQAPLRIVSSSMSTRLTCRHRLRPTRPSFCQYISGFMGVHSLKAPARCQITTAETLQVAET